MQNDEETPLSGIKGNGEGTMKTSGGKSNYGVLHDNGLDDVPTTIHHDQFNLVAERRSRAGSTGSVYPYDMVTPYETIDDLRVNFTYLEPQSTKWGWIRTVALKRINSAKRLIPRPRHLLFTLLPISKSLQSYTWEDLMWDTTVGVSMATLQVPQGMAFATVAGIPLVYGLYIVWFPGLVYALFGGCREVSYGPYALVGLLLSDGLSKYGYKPCHGICSSHQAISHEEERYLTAALGVSFLVGILFLMAAFFNLGRAMSSLLPHPVISGFIQASAILIMVSQLPTFFQTPSPSSKGFIRTLESVFVNWDKINWVSVIFGTAAVVIYLSLNFANKKFKAKQVNLFIPEAIFVVACATAVNYFCDLDGKYGLRQVGHIPIGLPHPKLPKYDGVENLLDMLQVAVSTGLISYIVTQSITTTVQKSKHVCDSVSPNNELVAYGLANILGSMFLSLPCSASLSRAAIIEQMGPSSQLHAIATFIFLTLFLLFFPPLLEFLPQTVLSATIFSVVYKFIKPKMCYSVWKASKVEFIMLLSTFVTTLFMGVLQGLLVGISASFLSLVVQTYSPTVLVLGKFPGMDVYRDVERYNMAEILPGIVCMRFGSSLHFANIDFFVQACRDSVSRRKHGRRTHSSSLCSSSSLENCDSPKRGDMIYFFVLDGSAIHGADSTALEKLENLVTEFMAHTPPIEILLGPVSDGFVDSIIHSPVLMGTIGRGCYISMNKAVSFARAQIKEGTLAVRPCERSPEAIYRNALDDGHNFT
eukprot:418152_1